MPDDVKLLPCPFCGGTEHEIGVGDAGHDVYCHSFACRASTGAWPSRSEAIAAWNRRTLPSLPSDIDGLVSVGLRWLRGDLESCSLEELSRAADAIEAALRARQAPEGVVEAAHAALPPDRQLYVTKDDLRAALSAMHSGAVRVRKLKWKPGSLVGSLFADTLLGRYSFMPDIAALPAAWIDPRGNHHEVSDEKEALAAAQADYETRILSALTGGEQ